MPETSLPFIPSNGAGRCKTRRIGVLGGYGQVGREVISRLARHSSYALLIGGRDGQKADAAAIALGPFVESMQIDVLDAHMLRAFCERCELVINCCGPSGKVSANTARAALEARIHYVDLGGEQTLYDAIKSREKELISSNLIFVVSAGIYPGLMGLFPAALAHGQFDSVKCLEAWFACEGDVLSRNAAYDVVCSIQDGFGTGMAYYSDGKVIRQGIAPKSKRLPEPIGQTLGYPSFSQELLLLARSRRIREVRCYLSLLEKYMQTLFSIDPYVALESEEQKWQAADRLVKASEADLICKARCSMIFVHMEGTMDNSPRALTSMIKYEDKDARLTGMVAATVARLLLSDCGSNTGVHYPLSAVCPIKFMEMLGEQGLVPHTVFDSRFMEEGRI